MTTLPSTSPHALFNLITAPGVFASGVAIFLIVLWDAFEAIILPRRVTRKFRLTRFYYRTTWACWKFLVCIIQRKKAREALLGFYGPFSLIALIAVWAVGLVLSFGMMQFGAGSALIVNGSSPGFWTDLYLSGTTFFTLGLGDVVPRSHLARFLVVAEGGFGFGFLAVIIGYLPFIYSAFGQREVNISLLDSRAGTPPTAGELLRRHAYPGGQDSLRALFKDWELWCAELMESHLSYPVLAYFRSQHDNQSWIASLTAILDACSLTITGIEGGCAKQAELTFAIARHAIVDLSQIFGAAPTPLPTNRLPDELLVRIRAKLAKQGTLLRDTPEANQKLRELRDLYEPYLYALANYLAQTLPPWIPEKKGKDNWQTSAWGRSAGMLEEDADAVLHDDHL